MMVQRLWGRGRSSIHLYGESRAEWYTSVPVTPSIAHASCCSFITHSHRVRVTYLFLTLILLSLRLCFQAHVLMPVGLIVR